MRILILILAGLACALLLVMAYARTVRLDPAVWHTTPVAAEPGAPDRSTPNSYISHRSYAASPGDVLNALDAIARATPRTVVLAGSVEEGMITYVTRSAFWGFPDVTTVQADAAEAGGARLSLHGRAVMGYSDLGVNANRIQTWLGALEGDLEGARDPA